jgi:hypothetical protein
VGCSGRRWTGLRRLWGRWGRKTEARSPADVLSRAQIERVLRKFVAHAIHDPALQDYARSQQVTTHYVLSVSFQKVGARVSRIANPTYVTPDY